MEKITDKPRMLSELANFYHVDVKTFKEWLSIASLSDISGEKKGYFFSIKQVKRIVEHLGEP